MNLTWTINPQAPRDWLSGVMMQTHRVFAPIPHDFSELSSGAVFFRCRGKREHGVTYVASRDNQHPHVLTVHLEHPDPILLELAGLIHRSRPDATVFEPEIHTREVWATEVLAEMECHDQHTSPEQNQMQ